MFGLKSKDRGITHAVAVTDLLEIKKLIFDKLEIDHRLCEKMLALAARIKGGASIGADVQEEIHAVARAAATLQTEGTKLGKAILDATPSRSLVM